jgi:hypothetical protein
MTLRKSELVFRGGLLAGFAVLLTTLITAQSIPTDPKPTCVVTPSTFATWFQSGTPSANGAVNPANSVTFSGSSNCAFYQWSEQMFLWLTSPAPSQYGGDGRVFDSPVFYDVSAADSNGQRHFLPHVPGQLRFFNVRAAQVGPHGLPVIFDRTGHMFEIERPQTAPSGRPLIRNAAGSLVEVGNVTLGANRVATFTDAAGRLIHPQLAPKPAVAAARTLKNPLTVQRFFSNGRPVFVDPFGNVLDIETGQAGGGGALIAQNKSLIYYTTMANDVFAYFASGTKNGGITPAPTQFPTTAADLAKITTYASTFGVTFPDPNALAIEVKAAWIEVTNLPNAGNYITMDATIPTYDTSDPAQWVPNGQKPAKLAMVGMHVVGSTAGHPEMLWATFEHFSNAPAATYQYVNTSGQTITVNQNTSGNWVFTANGAAAPFNAEIAQSACSNTIYGIPPPVQNCPPPAPPTVAIKPSNVIRWKPWGAASNTRPNPLDASAAASNTEIISIHNTVTVPGGDIRNNYFMTGTTWTIGGAAPNGSFSVDPTKNEVGTSLLANTTMETFQQGNGNTNADGSNCFSCHTTNTTSVSHVFGALQPLTPAQLKSGK